VTPNNLEEQLEPIDEPIIVHGASEEDLRACLKELEKLEEVVGYIFRTKNSASIDLKEPSKIIDYAMLSSAVIFESEKLAKTFELGNIQKILVEGQQLKLLVLIQGENKINIFLEKDGDYEKILGMLPP